MRITVFCSQYDVAEKYKSAAEALARLVGAHKHTLVWGGVDRGMMGLIARVAQRAGARVVGVIRDQIQDKAYKDADEIIVVEDSREMNDGLIERGDVIVVLPGGIGTLNELTEVLRMIKNGLLTKRIVVVNTDNFYEHFEKQLQGMQSEGFLTKKVLDSVRFVETPEAAIEHIERERS